MFWTMVSTESVKDDKLAVNEDDENFSENTQKGESGGTLMLKITFYSHLCFTLLSFINNRV